MHENKISMHENEIFIYENNVSMHENENVAPPPFKYSSITFSCHDYFMHETFRTGFL